MTFEQHDFDEVTTPLKVVTLVTLFILWGMLTPICLVYGFRFWVFRQCQVLKKRYSFIACIEILFVLIGFFTNGFIILSDSLLIVWLRQLAFHITIFVQYCIMYCWLWRFWLIYYDMEWMVVSLSVQWRRLINSRSKNHTPSMEGPNWFLDHKHTFGNRAWVGRRLAVFVVVSSIIAIICRYEFDFTDNEPIGESIYLFFYFVPFLGLGILRCRLPAFTDSIYIKQEMKYIMVVLIAILLAFGVQEIAEGHFHDVPNTQLIINILFYVAIELCNFLCILITTRYVLRKVSILLNEQIKSAAGADPGKHKKVNSDSSINSSNVNYVELKGDESAPITPTQRKLGEELTQCLSNEKSFELFMKFLAKEFSIECLLSFVEMVQFKQYMKKRMDSKGNSDDDDAKENESQNGSHKGSLRKDSDLEMKFPSSVPLSEIVFNDDGGNVSVKAKIYKFYLKYIKVNSEFEINILDSTRKRLIDTMKDYNVWMNNNYYDEVGLLHFYDGCIDEMKILLVASFRRFKEYHKDDLLEIYVND